MRILKTLLCCAFVLSSFTLIAQSPESKSGWQLGAQAYSFRLFTFTEALRKIDSCGLSNVEAYPGQKLGGDLEGVMDYKMDAGKRAAIKRLLKSKKIKMTAFGVINVTGEEDWISLFEFAKDMGISNINTEASPDQFKFLFPLAEKYKINVAFHNHPSPSKYWHPDSVLKHAGNNKYVGACADIGHWVRSGLDPVECLKKLEGKVLGLHFKDVVLEKNSKNKYHDVVWGQGKSKVDEVIAELKRQKFKGPISAEYEHNWKNSVPDITASVKYFREAFSRIKTDK